MTPNILSSSVERAAVRQPLLHDMVWVPGGKFRMGSDHHYPEEAPARDVSVHGFWMDVMPVTNAAFERLSHQGRLVSLRPQLLSALPPRRA